MVTFPQTCGWQKPFHCLVYVRAPFRLLWIKSLYLWSSKDWCFSWGSTDIYTSDTAGTLYMKRSYSSRINIWRYVLFFCIPRMIQSVQRAWAGLGISPWLIYPSQYFYWAHQHDNFIRCAELLIQLSIIAISISCGFFSEFTINQCTAWIHKFLASANSNGAGDGTFQFYTAFSFLQFFNSIKYHYST